jgi:hypothetical protein
MARNEAIAAALLSGVVVCAVSFRASIGALRDRAQNVACDMVVFVTPVVTAFAGWAIVSRVITGEFFAQLQSVYGTTSQLNYLGGAAATAVGHISPDARVGIAVVSLAPLGAVSLLAAGIYAFRHWDLRVLAPLAVLGGGLLFDMAAFPTGKTSWSYRYYISAVPLDVLLAGAAIAAVAGGSLPLQRLPAGRSAAAGVLALLLVGPSIFTSAVAMDKPTIGFQEHAVLGIVFSPHHLDATQRAQSEVFSHVAAADRYINSLHLKSGSIVIDTASPCVPDLIVQAKHPKVFVITNDRDFERILANPTGFGAHYLVAPNPGIEGLDAVDREYPTLYATGGGFAKQIHQFNLPYCGTYRLFHLIRASTNL